MLGWVCRAPMLLGGWSVEATRRLRSQPIPIHDTSHYTPALPTNDDTNSTSSTKYVPPFPASRLLGRSLLSSWRPGEGTDCACLTCLSVWPARNLHGIYMKTTTQNQTGRGRINLPRRRLGAARRARENGRRGDRWLLPCRSISSSNIHTHSLSGSWGCARACRVRATA